MATHIQLPKDIISDILSRLPVKSLLRFRCVCKPWCALITGPFFIKLHLSRSLACNNSNISLNFKGLYVYSVNLDACKQQQAAVELIHPLKSTYCKLVGSCNGLLCIYYSREDIFLWNPSTRRQQKLPFSPIVQPNGSRFIYFDIGYGFGYDPSKYDYKLVRVVQFYCYHEHEESEDEDNYVSYSEVKVYSLSTNSWRRILGDMPLHSEIENQYGVLANSILHWTALRETGPSTNSDFIFSFDLLDNEYGEVPLPDFEHYKIDMNIGVLGGQLCIFCHFSDHFEVLVTKEYGVRDSWVKQFSIKRPLVYIPDCKPVTFLKNGKVILEMNSEELVLYDPHIGSARNFRFMVF